MPRLQDRVDSGRLRLRAAMPDLPSGTLSFHAGLFYGHSLPIPGTRWWDRTTSQVIDATSPASLRRLEKTLFGNGTPLLEKGSAYGAQITGRSASHLCVATSRSQILRQLRRIPAKGLFSAALLALEHSRREVAHRFHGTAHRGCFKPKNAPFRHGIYGPMAASVTTDLALQDLHNGIPIIFANFFGHDTFSHHFGPADHLVETLLSIIDKQLEKLFEAVDKQAKQCDVLLLSDHGQAPCQPFHSIYGMRLEQFVGDLGRVTAVQAHLPLRVFGSGNLAHIYFPSSRPMLFHEIKEAVPGFIRILSRHPGIHIVACRGEDGSTVLASEANVVQLPRGTSPPSRLDLGEKGQVIVERIGALLAGQDSGDLILFGKSVDGRLVSFLDQRGCHNGFLAHQLECFIATTAGLELDIPETGLATSLHRQLLSLQAPRREAKESQGHFSIQKSPVDVPRRFQP